MNIFTLQYPLSGILLEIPSLYTASVAIFSYFIAFAMNISSADKRKMFMAYKNPPNGGLLYAHIYVAVAAATTFLQGSVVLTIVTPLVQLTVFCKVVSQAFFPQSTAWNRPSLHLILQLAKKPPAICFICFFVNFFMFTSVWFIVYATLLQPI